MLARLRFHGSRRRIPLLVLCALLGGCGASSNTEAPAFAESTQAEREYRNLRAHFFASARGERSALQADAQAFIAHHPRDAQADTVRLFLAWMRLEQEEFTQARQLIADVKRAGRNFDYLVVTEAALSTRTGEPEHALALLTPLAGKIVDPDERVVHGEERVRALLAARQFERAVHAMVDWLAQAPADRYEDVRKTVVGLLSRIPADDLLRALAAEAAVSAETTSAETASVRSFVKKSIYSELAHRALEAADATLARALLPHAPLSLRSTPEYSALVRQAAAGSAAARVAGRSVGLFLNLGSERARRRSAAFAAGVSRGLEGAQPAVELVVRDDAGSAERTVAALSALAGDGAALLIAGIDPASARLAAQFAERAHIPLLLVGDLPDENPSYVFALGVSASASAAALGAALEQRGRHNVVTVGASGGVSCEVTGSFAGRARFPVDDWRKQHVDGVLVLGDSGCARDVAREVRVARLPALVACDFECGDALGSSGAAPELALASGKFPSPGTAGITYYEALGRDAALLARTALADLPEQGAVDREQVGELHERARKSLQAASVALLTSDARGFGRAHVLPRTLSVVDGASQPDFKGPK